MLHFEYDELSNEILGGYKSIFEAIVTEKIYSLVQHIKTNIYIVLKVDDNVWISFEEISEDSSRILINLKKFQEQGFDLAKYIEHKVPVEKWYVWRKWYGKKITFLGAIEHEMRHYMDKRYQQIQSKTTGCKAELDLAVVQIRSEAYPKLYDSNMPVEFSHEKLYRIKYAILSYMKTNGMQIPKDFEERKKYFLGIILPGDHHYYLAMYMSYMIAYSLMDQNTIINSRTGLKVKDIDAMITEGLPMAQPSREIKDKAGDKIKNSTPHEFLALFEESTKKLHISDNNIPLSYSIYKKMSSEL